MPESRTRQSASFAPMRDFQALLVGFLLLASAPVVAGCSSKGDATPDANDPYGACVAFVDDGGASANVSFVMDVAPIFQNNCTSGGFNCHGTSQNLPYLGSADGGADPANMLVSIVDVPSPEDPAMKLVAPGDPQHSYLMHKLDWDQCTLLADCTTNNFAYLNPRCGNDMPNGAAMLPLALRDTIRAWIRQGANNN